MRQLFAISLCSQVQAACQKLTKRTQLAIFPTCPTSFAKIAEHTKVLVQLICVKNVNVASLFENGYFDHEILTVTCIFLATYCQYIVS